MNSNLVEFKLAIHFNRVVGFYSEEKQAIHLIIVVGVTHQKFTIWRRGSDVFEVKNITDWLVDRNVVCKKMIALMGFAAVVYFYVGAGSLLSEKGKFREIFASNSKQSHFIEGLNRVYFFSLDVFPLWRLCFEVDPVNVTSVCTNYLLTFVRTHDGLVIYCIIDFQRINLDGYFKFRIWNGKVQKMSSEK